MVWYILKWHIRSGNYIKEKDILAIERRLDLQLPFITHFELNMSYEQKHYMFPDLWYKNYMDEPT